MILRHTLILTTFCVVVCFVKVKGSLPTGDEVYRAVGEREVRVAWVRPTHLKDQFSHPRNLMGWDTRGGAERPLVPGTSHSFCSPRFTADGNRIVYLDSAGVYVADWRTGVTNFVRTVHTLP
ncbi:MAG: hypothetical protein GF344_03705, partial [Chitinivibrionales bacterium]|nr:hypothetical protein [Chitinivibrionales bacterium]